MKESDQLSLLSDSLDRLFGLKQSTIDRIIRTIKTSSDITNAKEIHVRKRIGTRALSHLNNAIDISKSRKGKHMSESNTTSPQSFTQFLIQEAQIDVDLNDQQGSMTELRRAQRLNKSSPERVNKENIDKAKDEQRDAQQNNDDPSSNIKAKIAKKKIEMGGLNRRLNAMNRQTQQTQQTDQVS